MLAKSCHSLLTQVILCNKLLYGGTPIFSYSVYVMHRSYLGRSLWEWLKEGGEVPELLQPLLGVGHSEAALRQVRNLVDFRATVVSRGLCELAMRACSGDIVLKLNDHVLSSEMASALSSGLRSVTFQPDELRYVGLVDTDLLDQHAWYSAWFAAAKKYCITGTMAKTAFSQEEETKAAGATVKAEQVEKSESEGKDVKGQGGGHKTPRLNLRTLMACGGEGALLAKSQQGSEFNFLVQMPFS